MQKQLHSLGSDNRCTKLASYRFLTCFIMISLWKAKFPSPQTWTLVHSLLILETLITLAPIFQYLHISQKYGQVIQPKVTILVGQQL
jgi:hypothetical protein